MSAVVVATLDSGDVVKQALSSLCAESMPKLEPGFAAYGLAGLFEVENPPNYAV